MPASRLFNLSPCQSKVFVSVNAATTERVSVTTWWATGDNLATTDQEQKPPDHMSSAASTPFDYSQLHTASSFNCQMTRTSSSYSLLKDGRHKGMSQCRREIGGRAKGGTDEHASSRIRTLQNHDPTPSKQQPFEQRARGG